MSDHRDPMDTPEQNAPAGEPIAATRREQRERGAASPTAGTQADVRQNVPLNDTSMQNVEREAAARQDATQYDAGLESGLTREPRPRPGTKPPSTARPPITT